MTKEIDVGKVSVKIILMGEHSVVHMDIQLFLPLNHTKPAGSFRLNGSLDLYAEMHQAPCIASCLFRYHSRPARCRHIPHKVR